jgi:hypothetical protein
VENVGRFAIERENGQVCKRLKAGLKASVAFHLLSAWPVFSNESDPPLKRLFSGDDTGKNVGFLRLFAH